MNYSHILTSGSAAPTIISTMNFYGRRWSAVSSLAEPWADHAPTKLPPLPPYPLRAREGYGFALEGSPTRSKKEKLKMGLLKKFNAAKGPRFEI
jgi:hypothetical protein